MLVTFVRKPNSDSTNIFYSPVGQLGRWSILPVWLIPVPLGWDERFELSTYGITIRRSTNWAILTWNPLAELNCRAWFCRPLPNHSVKRTYDYLRIPRLELGLPAWKAGILPLNYTRKVRIGYLLGNQSSRFREILWQSTGFSWLGS